MKRKDWVLSAADSRCVDEISQALSINPLAAKILVARGYTTIHEAQGFLDDSIDNFHDPFLLTDMQKAVDEITRAINAGEKIAVFGDYDVDGVTATCILVKYLKSKGADVCHYIPDRLGEGYGLNENAIATLYKKGSRLMITVDSGITAVEETNYANSIGMRMIITDHHECKDKLPDAIAVINPRREDSAYPFRELAGVGVAFKLICALENTRDIESLLDECADIVAVGTIADVMPLWGENRSIVSAGLARLKKTSNQGLKALMRKLGLLNKKITANSVSFVMAPRINAAGRLGGASVAAQLFLTNDANEAAELAQELCLLNTRRQQEENLIFLEILEMLRNDPSLTKGKILLLWGEKWHNGVMGIVASRLSDRYSMPCILISLDGQTGKGSGRSIKGFNLYAALERHAHLLEKFGGHELAVGLTIDKSNLQALKEGLEQYALEKNLSEIVPVINIDCDVTPQNITVEDIRGLSVLEPFGMGNPQPCLRMCGVIIAEITPISNDRHIKMLLTKDGYSFFGFMFGMGAKNCPFEAGDNVDVIFSAEINEYRDRVSVQLVIKDIKWSLEEDAADNESYDAYQCFKSGRISNVQAMVLQPTKTDIMAAFRYIKTNSERSQLNDSPRTMYRKIRYCSRGTINLGRFFICMDVFEEFDILSYSTSDEEILINIKPMQGKVNISGSEILKRLKDSL